VLKEAWTNKGRRATLAREEARRGEMNMFVERGRERGGAGRGDVAMALPVRRVKREIE